MAAQAAALGVGRRTLYDWAREWHWDHRLRAWDRYWDRRRTEAGLEYAEAVQRTQKRLLEKSAAIAEIGLDRIYRKLEEGAEGDLDVKDVRALLETHLKYTRLIAGEATERTEATGGDLSGLTLEELETLRQLHRKAREGGG